MPIATADVRRRRAGLAALLVAGFVGSVLYSTLVTRVGNQGATLWLATGFLSAVLILPPRPWRAPLALTCMAAHAIISLMIGDGFVRALINPLINLLEAGVAAWLAVKFCGARARRLSLQQLCLLVVAAIVPAAMIAAGVGAVANVFLRHQSLMDGWLLWFASTALGMTIVLPTLLLVARLGHYREFDRGWAETLALLGGLSVLTAMVFSQRELPVQFIIFPALTLVAIRLGPPGAAVATLLVAMIALPLVVHGGGPAALSPILDSFGRVRLTELVIMAALFTALATAVSIGEQTRLKALMLRRDRAARLARIRAREAEEVAAGAAAPAGARRSVAALV